MIIKFLSGLVWCQWWPHKEFGINEVFPFNETRVGFSRMAHTIPTMYGADNAH